MPKKLVVQFEGTLITWVVMDEGGGLECGPTQGQIETLLSFVKQGDLFILVPAKDVLLTEIKLPKLSKRKLMKALPFALEDKIVDELSHIHFSVGQIHKNSSIPTAVVNEAKMASWMSTLAAILKEKTPFNKIMLSEAQALPLSPRGWTVYTDGREAVVRLSGFQGFGIDLKYLWLLLRLFLNKAENIRPETIEIIGALAIPEGEAQFFKKANIQLEQKVAINKLVLMAKELDKRNNINLLQGKYKINFIPYLSAKLYLIGLGLLAAWLLTLTAGNLVKFYLLQSSLQRINQEIKQSYEKSLPLMPFAGKDVRAEMSNELQKLQSSNSDSGFLGALADLSSIVSSLPGLKLLSLEYENNTLILEFEAVSFSDIDKLLKGLKAKAFKIEHQDEIKAENRIHARLTIKRLSE